MIVLDLIKKLCPEKLPYKLGECIGDGADGEIFLLADDPTKVIKLSVIYDDFNDATTTPSEVYWEQISLVLDYIEQIQPTICVRVYEYGFLGEYSREIPTWRGGLQKFAIHYCVMERLNKLTDDEKRVFHSLISHEDRNAVKDLSPAKVENILAGLSTALDFDAARVRLFLDELRGSSLIHGDLHVRNIMKRDNGDYALIDLDRCTININN
jgi:hypothetical protein